MHVAYEDAERYAAWAGRALPTEAQWELAARGGLDGAAYAWGDAPEPPGERLANYWHGDFPWRAEPGYGTTAPVGSFPPNGLGLLRHGRQRVGVDGRLVHGAAPSRRRPAASRDPRGGSGRQRRPASRSSPCRARSSRAARSCAPTPTAGATAPRPGGRS